MYQKLEYAGTVDPDQPTQTNRNANIGILLALGLALVLGIAATALNNVGATCGSPTNSPFGGFGGDPLLTVTAAMEIASIVLMALAVALQAPQICHVNSCLSCCTITTHVIAFLSSTATCGLALACGGICISSGGGWGSSSNGFAIVVYSNPPSLGPTGPIWGASAAVLLLASIVNCVFTCCIRRRENALTAEYVLHNSVPLMEVQSTQPGGSPGSVATPMAVNHAGVTMVGTIPSGGAPMMYYYSPVMAPPTAAAAATRGGGPAVYYQAPGVVPAPNQPQQQYPSAAQTVVPTSSTQAETSPPLTNAGQPASPN